MSYLTPVTSRLIQTPSSTSARFHYAVKTMPWNQEHWKLNRLNFLKHGKATVTGAGMTRKTVHAEGKLCGILTHFVIITWVVLQNLFQQSRGLWNCMPCWKASPALSVPTSTSPARQSGQALSRLYGCLSRCPPVHTHHKFPSAVPPSSWKIFTLGTEFLWFLVIPFIKLDNSFFSWNTHSGFPFTSVLY